MNLPNILTVSRIVLTVFFIFFLYQNTLLSTVFAAVIFALAAWTDYLDGQIARKRKLESPFGKIMDPIADKFLMLSAFIMFAQMGVIAFWMVGLIFLREVTVTASRLLAMQEGVVLAAEKMGKVKTVLQIVAVSIILLFLILDQSILQNWAHAEDIFLTAINILMLATVIVTVVSGISYFKHRRKALVTSH